MKKILLIFTLISLFSFSEEIQRNFSIKNIRDIYSTGMVDIVITKGSNESLTITGKDSLLNDINIKTKGNYLDIDVPKKSYLNVNNKATISIVVKDLDSFEFAGTGDIIIKDFKGINFNLISSGLGNISFLNSNFDNLDIKITGKGTVIAEGKVENLTATVDGLGTLNAFSLETKTADVKLNGLGSIEVNVLKKLTAKVNGVGKVRYLGNPTLEKTELNGLGQIKKQGE